MALVDLSVRMRTTVRAGMGSSKEIGITCCPAPPGAGLELPWVWAVVQRERGLEDKFLIGGGAESQTAAMALAYKQAEILKAVWLKRETDNGIG